MDHGVQSESESFTFLEVIMMLIHSFIHFIL